MQYATKAEPSRAVPRSPAFQVGLRRFVEPTWASRWNLWGGRVSDTPFSSEDLEKIFWICPSYKPPFLLKQNSPDPRWKNLFQLLPFLFLKPIRDKKKKTTGEDGFHLMLDEDKGSKPAVATATTPGQGTVGWQCGGWAISGLLHQNICTDASQLPITAACTTRLWKALWCALMNKHLWLIGKCISRAPCCSPTSLLYYRGLAACPPSGAHLPVNRLRCERLTPSLLHPLQQHSWLFNHFPYPLRPSVLFLLLWFLPFKKSGC